VGYTLCAGSRRITIYVTQNIAAIHIINQIVVHMEVPIPAVLSFIYAAETTQYLYKVRVMINKDVLRDTLLLPDVSVYQARLYSLLHAHPSMLIAVEIL
jgi:hypothetical protein